MKIVKPCRPRKQDWSPRHKVGNRPAIATLGADAAQHDLVGYRRQGQFEMCMIARCGVSSTKAVMCLVATCPACLAQRPQDHGPLTEDEVFGGLPSL